MQQIMTDKLKHISRKITLLKRKIIIIALLIIISIISFYFTLGNESFYKNPIARITSVTEENSQAEAENGKNEAIMKQHIEAVIMNGQYKGKKIQLENTSSYSEVNDINYKVNDEVFLLIQGNSTKDNISAKIIDLKRDKYIVYTISIFIVLMLLIGGIKGARSLASVGINILICLMIVEMVVKNYNMVLICVLASALFILLSIIIVGGVNKKTISAAMSTIGATVVTMIITILIISLTHWNGIHFEEMEFLTLPPEGIFIMEILIGTLGAIMDIAISISSSINEIMDKNPEADIKELIRSGKEIGRDIMGAMTNTLVLAYISGSMPIIILMLRNGFSVSYITSIDLSLEIVRALTGSIGIVLSIPIAIYTSVLVLKKGRIGEERA